MKLSDLKEAARLQDSLDVINEQITLLDDENINNIHLVFRTETLILNSENTLGRVAGLVYEILIDRQIAVKASLSKLGVEVDK